MFMRLFVFVVVLQSLLFSADGDLDTSFGTDGKVFTQIGGYEDTAKGVAIQGDGKIVTAGWSQYDSTGKYEFAVVRYNTSGNLDTSFGTGGKATTNVGGDNNGAHSIAIQSDGKIVAAGKSDLGAFYNWKFAVVRYDINGNLDKTFDGDGIVITPVNTSTHGGYANGVAIQSDGRIVAAGRSYDSGDYDFALVRYDINGSLDKTFDGDGKVITTVGSFSSIAKSVAIQENGKIIASGYSETFSDYDFALVRYDINGSLDKTFDGDGRVITDIDGKDDKATSMAIQGDGKIIVTGFSDNGNDWDFALVRYDINGSLDKTFGTDGIVITAISEDDSDEPYGIAIQSDGKIVVVGSSEINSNTNFAIVRYNTDGSLDTTFGADGKVTTDMGGGEGGAQGIAIQSDDRIVTAGVGNDGGDQDFAIARYQGKPMVLAPIYYLLGM